MSGLLQSMCLLCRSPKRLLCLVLAGLISVHTPVVAEGPVEIRATDVSLAGEGVLKGSVLNSAAQPVAGIHVAVFHGETRVATATSSDEGQFVVKGLRNGAHTIQVGTSVHPVRFWQSEMAPPAAVEQMSVVVQEDVVLGQQSSNSNLLPILVIGGAVAIVLGTTLGDDDDPSTGGGAPVSP